MRTAQFAVAAWIAPHATLGDVDTTAWQSDGPDWAGGSQMVFLFAPLSVYLAVRKKESVVRYTLAALLAPAIALGVGLLNADNRRWQMHGHEVFAAYTHRFARGQLHDEYAFGQVDRYLTVCAQEGREDPNDAPDDKRFCLEMVVGDNRRDKAQGGYRYYADVIDEFGQIDPFGCFGNAIMCGGKQGGVARPE